MRVRKLLPGAIFCAVLLFVVCVGVLRTMEDWVQDAVYQRLSVVSPDIYVIGIDEKTLMELGPFENWSRSATAELIDTLCADPAAVPAVIGIDIGFYGEKDKADDARLAEAAARAGNVVVASYANFGGEIVDTAGGGFYARRAVQTLERPYDALRAVTTSGFTNAVTDYDGIIRHSLVRLGAPDGTPERSFANMVYRAAFPDRDVRPPLDADGRWYLPFSGGPGDYFGASFSDVLDGTAPAAQFAGSIVLVGPYSAGMKDAYYTPASRSEQMYGVELHANSIQALMEQNFKRELPFAGQIALVAVTLALAFLLCTKLDLRVSGLVFILLTAAYCFTGVKLYEAGWLLPLVTPLFCLWMVYLFQIFYRYLTEVRARRRLLDVFGKYVSPEVARSIAEQGEATLRLGGLRRDIAVLFVDIRGFTTLSEGMEPEQVVELLNRYFELTTQAVFENGGTVDKFIGDATMAVFNVPLETDDYELRAVKTGLAITAGGEKLEKEFFERYGKKVGFGVGVNCGPAVVGNIGTQSRMEYTAIGDTVNTASRLEGQAAAGEVIISEALYSRLSGKIAAESLGGRKLKGKSGETAVYRVNGILLPGQEVWETNSKECGGDV